VTVVKELTERESALNLSLLGIGGPVAQLTVKQQIREDFMKRWFAIAISVGFATALANMPWLRDEATFDWKQGEQVARLTVAMIATLLSWEGYLLSISSKPLEEASRFWIDVFLVLLYLFLLLTSKFAYFWLWIHAAAFALYCVWDFLSIRGHRPEYVNKDVAPKSYEPSIGEVYKGSLTDHAWIYRGPAITLMWPVYFWALPLTYYFWLPAEDRAGHSATLLYAFFVFLGLIGYRTDKQERLTFPARILVLALGVLLLLNAHTILGLV
jgi:hypothetical protein